MRRRFNQLPTPIKFILIVFCFTFLGTLLITALGNKSLKLHNIKTDRGFVEDITLNERDFTKGIVSPKEKVIEEQIWELDPNDVSEENAQKILRSLTKLNKYMLMTGGNMTIGENCMKQKEVTFGACVEYEFENSPELQAQFQRTTGFMKIGIEEMEKGGMQIYDIPFIQEFFSD